MSSSTGAYRQIRPGFNALPTEMARTDCFRGLIDQLSSTDFCPALRYLEDPDEYLQPILVPLRMRNLRHGDPVGTPRNSPW
jgi:hypothetical protein